MKKIAIVLLTAFALTSCGGGAETTEVPATDSTAVVAPATSTTTPVVADSTKADTAAVKK